MTAALPHFTAEDLYAGMCAAWRKGSYRHAMFFAVALKQRLTGGGFVRLRDWERRIPVIVETERAARERLGLQNGGGTDE
jgi:hypothetical protein